MAGSHWTIFAIKWHKSVYKELVLVHYTLHFFNALTLKCKPLVVIRAQRWALQNRKQPPNFTYTTKLYPSIIFCLSGAGSRGQQSKQRCPDFPLPRHFLLLLRGNTEAFPGQSGDIIPSTCPGSSSGSPPSGTHPKHFPRKAFRTSCS